MAKVKNPNKEIILRTVYLTRGVDRELRYMAFRRKVTKNKLISQLLDEAVMRFLERTGMGK